MSLTQYLESQEDQDMTKLLYFIRTQEMRREGFFFFWLGMEEMGGLYSSGGENINGMSFVVARFLWPKFDLSDPSPKRNSQ